MSGRGEGPDGPRHTPAEETRLYRWLADRVLPREYAERAADEMVMLAGDLLRDARAAGRLRYLVRWIVLHGDLLVTALAVRLEGRTMPGLRGDLGIDLRVSLRRLRRTPGYALSVVTILALGVGVTTAIFQSLNSVLLRPLPYPNAERLVAVRPIFDGESPAPRMSPRMAADVATVSTSIERVATFDGGTMAFSDGGPAELVRAGWASPDLFDVLGVEVQRGRTFIGPDTTPGGDDVVVLSDAGWTRLLGRDPALLERVVTLDGRSYDVIGVLPADFEDPTTGEGGWADVWVPISVQAGDALYDATWVAGIGLLREGVALAEARGESDALARRLGALNPDAYGEGLGLAVEGLREGVWGDASAPLLLLLGAAGLVLLVACANLAGLVVARSADRTHDVAVLTALGAGRARIARQAFLESLLLALVGGALGVLVAAGLQDVVGAFLGGDLPRLSDPVLDLRVVGFALAASGGASVLFGGLPAWRASRANPLSALGEGRPGRGTARRGRLAADGLLVGQMAVSLALLVGAISMVRTLDALLAVDTGFEPERVLAFELRLPSASYPTAGEILAFHDRVLESLAALPGATAVGAVDKRPLGSRWGCRGVVGPQHGTPARPEDWPCAESRAVTPDYFRTMGIGVVSGRPIEPGDGADAAPVVVVNRRMADLFWPGESALGRRLRWYGDEEAGVTWRTVVGVVGDVKHRGLAQEAVPEVYMPYRQAPDRRMTFVVRSSDPRGLADPVRARVTELDPDLPVRDVATMDEAVLGRVTERRVASLLLGGLAVLAVLLSLTGVHAGMAFHVRQRRREIGVRVALGARRGEVLNMVFRRSAKLAVAALLAGLPLAYGLGVLLEGALYQVGPLDPESLGASAAAVLLTALLAGVLPARRAAGVDPVDALRSE